MNLKEKKQRICKKCVYDNMTPGIFFDSKGICNYCHQIEDLLVQYGTGSEKGISKFKEILDKIKLSGKNKKYDCVIGLSGGTDSSFLLIKAKEWGLRPLAVHYDNTWNTSIATENIRKVTKALDIDLYTYVVDNKEVDDIFRSFVIAGVPEFDASTDIAFAQVMRMAAAKYKIKYIFEGHSFVAEGVSPQGKNYFDGRYIKDIHKRFGKIKMKTFPNMSFFEFLKWIIFYRQKFIRPLWYIDYNKEEARQVLTETTGWSYYGGHHLENRSPFFLHTIYNPLKFGIDNRSWSIAADVRAGRMSRNDAIKILQEPIKPDQELINYVKKRLNFSDDEYQKYMKGKKKSFRDFKTYKKRFEFFRPLFYVFAKLDLVPMSFYLKYCFPLNQE